MIKVKFVVVAVEVVGLLLSGKGLEARGICMISFFKELQKKSFINELNKTPMMVIKKLQ